MQHRKKFICLSYPAINFFIAEEKIPSAICCQKENMHDSRIKINSSDVFETELPYIDFDLCAQLFCRQIASSSMRTALVLKSQGLFDGSENFALITSADCKIIEKEIRTFSLFSTVYFEFFKSRGILAGDFSKEKNGFLLDVRSFLDFYKKWNLQKHGEPV